MPFPGVRLIVRKYLQGIHLKEIISLQKSLASFFLIIKSLLEIISQNGLQGQPKRLCYQRRISQEMLCVFRSHSRIFFRDFLGLFMDFFLKEIETRSEQKIFFKLTATQRCGKLLPKNCKIGIPGDFFKTKKQGGLLFYTLGKCHFKSLSLIQCLQPVSNDL